MHKTKFIPVWFRYLIGCCIAIIATGLVIGTQESETTDSKLLYDRVWLDSMPEMSHDEFRAYMFTADNVGINFHGLSAFKVVLEVFEFRAKGDTLKFHFPHDGLREASSFSISPLDKPTDHFDTKLELSLDPKTGSSKTYYTGPELGSLETMSPELRQQVLAELSQLQDR